VERPACRVSACGRRGPGRETDASAAPAEKPKPTIAERKENQRDGIADGVKSGQLIAGETAKLERQQRINRQVAADRKANGGKLDASQNQQINRERNAASGNVHRSKHSRRTQPGAPKP
jgi:hypothetical protein